MPSEQTVKQLIEELDVLEAKFWKATCQNDRDDVGRTFVYIYPTLRSAIVEANAEIILLQSKLDKAEREAEAGAKLADAMQIMNPSFEPDMCAGMTTVYGRWWNKKDTLLETYRSAVEKPL